MTTLVVECALCFARLSCKVQGCNMQHARTGKGLLGRRSREGRYSRRKCSALDCRTNSILNIYGLQGRSSFYQNGRCWDDRRNTALRDMRRPSNSIEIRATREPCLVLSRREAVREQLRPQADNPRVEFLHRGTPTTGTQITRLLFRVIL